MRRLELRHILAVTAIASALIAAAPPAQASRGGGDPSTSPQVEVDGGGTLADLSQLYPGASGQSTFSVTNTSSEDAILAFRIVNLRDDDNGCERPETTAGDDTCGDGGGELGRDLRLAVAPLGADGNASGAAVLDGSARGLATWSVADLHLPAGGTQSYRFDWDLPADSPDDTQTDTLAFDVEFVLAQDITEGGDFVPQPDGPEGADTPVDPEVMGAQIEPTGTGTLVPGTQLPRTGTNSFRAFELGSIAVTIGSLLLALTWRRRGSAS